jgi:thiamine-phosphate pyrophosphorylase
MEHTQRLAAFEAADLYVVISSEFCGGRNAVDILVRTLMAGVRIVQLREKNLTHRGLYELAQEFRRLTKTAGALLIIDDRVDIALASGADGVHLGQEDLPLEAARHLAPDLIIGASTHSLEEALAAEAAGASYVNIGPIFATQTKPDVPPLGLEAIDRIAPNLQIPWTTMGGINLENIGQVVFHGARHPAVMSAVTAAPDPQAAALGLRQIILAGGERPQRLH